MTVLGIDDLTSAAALAFRWHCADPALRGNWETRYALLRAELGVSIDPLDDNDRDRCIEPAQQQAFHLCRHAIIALAELPDPFGGYFESSGIVNAMWRKHHVAIDAAKGALASALRPVAQECFEVLAPGVSTRTTTDADLIAAGLAVHAPDPGTSRSSPADRSSGRKRTNRQRGWERLTGSTPASTFSHGCSRQNGVGGRLGRIRAGSELRIHQDDLGEVDVAGKRIHFLSMNQDFEALDLGNIGFESAGDGFHSDLFALDARRRGSTQLIGKIGNGSAVRQEIKGEEGRIGRKRADFGVNWARQERVENLLGAEHRVD